MPNATSASVALVVAWALAAAPVLAQPMTPASGPHARSAPVAPIADTRPQPGYETVVTVAPAAPAERRADAMTIATTPRRTGEDLLRLVPGLLISRHGAEGKGRQIFLRGFDAVHGSDVEVTLDGVPLNEPSNVHGQGYLDLGLIIPEAIEQVAAVKGPFRLDQGSFATAGSVRFTLGVPEGYQGPRVSYEAGSTNRHRILGLWAPGGGSFVALEALRDSGYGSNRGAERASALAKSTLWSDGAGRAVDAWASVYAARFGEPGTLPLEDVRAGRAGFWDSYSPDTRGTSARAIGAIRYRSNGAGTRTTVQVHGRARGLSLSENFTGFLVDPVRGDRLAQRHEAAGGGMRAEHEHTVGLRLMLVAGTDAWAEGMTQREDRVDERDVPWQRTRDLAGLQGGASARAGLRWLPLTWARIEAGVRGDAFFFDVADGTGAMPGRAAVLLASSPRASATVFASDEITILAAYGRGVRPPEARALLRPGGPMANTDLRAYGGGTARPTISDGAELGLRGRAPGGLTLGADLFGSWLQHEQIFDHVSATNLELGATRRLGVELSAAWRPRSWLELRMDATAVQARFVRSGAPVPGAPSLMATAEAHVAHPRGLRGGAFLTALGPRALAHGARAGGAAVLDLLAGWLWSRLELTVSVDNALGARWREGEFHYASWWGSGVRSELPRIHFAAGPPRTVRAGITAWF